VEPEPEDIREAKKRWAELLRRIFEVDPLASPRCGDEMRMVSFFTEPNPYTLDATQAEERFTDSPESARPFGN